MKEEVEIDGLIARFLSGEASPEEAIQLEDWKAASVNNKTYLDGVAKIVVLTIADEAETKRQAWMSIKAEIEKKNHFAKAITFKWKKPGIAALVIMLVAAGVLFKYSNTKSLVATGAVAYKTGNSAKKIQLKDSSEIVLAPNSSITLDKDFGKNNRDVSLSGSAFVSVKHDSSLPFVININQLHIKDVGTKFQVASKSDTILVTMEEGEVLMYDNFGAKQKLAGNDKARYVIAVKKIEIYADTLPKNNLPVNAVTNKKHLQKKPKALGIKADSIKRDEIRYQ